MRAPVLAIISDAEEFEAIVAKTRRLEWMTGPKLNEPVPDGPLRDAADAAIFESWFAKDGKRVVGTPDDYPQLAHARLDVP